MAFLVCSVPLGCSWLFLPKSHYHLDLASLFIDI
jgi:hypothetical protein